MIKRLTLLFMLLCLPAQAQDMEPDMVVHPYNRSGNFHVTNNVIVGGNVALLPPTAATSGTKQVASSTFALQGSAWNNAPASQSVPTTIQWTPGPGDNSSNALFNITATSTTGFFSALTEFRLKGNNAYLNVWNSNDNVSAFYGETFQTVEFGIKNNIGSTQGIVPANSSYAFLGLTQSGVVETMQTAFGNPSGRNVLDDGSSSARVGIGTTTMASKFEVNGNASIGYPDTAAPTNGMIVQGAVALGTSAQAASNELTVTGTATISGATTLPGLASSNAAQTGSVCWTTSTGNLTIDTTTTCLLSARRFKEQITPLKSGLQEVMALKPMSYFYKDRKFIPDRQVGLIAEDVADVDKRLVSYEKDGQLHSVRYENLTAVLVKAIQEQQKEIDALKKRRN